MKTTRSAIAAAVTIAALACGNGRSAAELRAALPSHETLTIQTPLDGNALALGDRSELYTLTRVTTVTINSSIGAVFDLLEKVVAMPPTRVQDGEATWGPGGDAGDPNVYRLVVTEPAEDRYEYALEYRPKTSPEANASYRTLITGSADKTSGIHDGTGTMVLSMDAWAAADGAACGAGRLDVAYDTTSEPQRLGVAFAGLRTCEAPDEVIDGVTYAYARYADGSGTFDFSAPYDLHRGSIQPAVDEALEIRSRWNASGAGRSDTRVTGGDLPASVPSVTASECWNTSFALVYGTIDPAEADPTRITGDLSQCAFAQTSLPGSP